MADGVASAEPEGAGVIGAAPLLQAPALLVGLPRPPAAMLPDGSSPQPASFSSQSASSEALAAGLDRQLAGRPFIKGELAWRRITIILVVSWLTFTLALTSSTAASSALVSDFPPGTSPEEALLDVRRRSDWQVQTVLEFSREISMQESLNSLARSIRGKSQPAMKDVASTGDTQRSRAKLRGG